MMKHFVGLDVSVDLTSVCVLDEAGALVWRGKVASTPEALTEAIRKHAPSVVKIGLETDRCAHGIGTHSGKRPSCRLP
ncbi:hypothetical protein NKH74_34080 [Mesorhizobium sp. M0933]|uniref:hypothetical protein n=1 Tax=Mesorhizobium sp. M0933 TaxID=2957030 RepID=UPI003339E627